VNRTNTVSQNLYAEQLLLAAAGAAEGRRDMAAARRMFAQHLVRWGVDPSECFLADGSGLSRENLISPRAFSALLRAQLSSPHRKLFLNSLPRSGSSGTLGERLRSLPAGFEVRAKTGSISLVKGLSGYLLRDGVVRRSFSILVNDTTRVEGEEVKRDIDRLVRALVDDLAAQ
jgi:D-alanyl-D-alanine carboxypeptidase/D-alanyl-D-alanine-endopeptidase (penicillin-binding protein 4)